MFAICFYSNTISDMLFKNRLKWIIIDYNVQNYVCSLRLTCFSRNAVKRYKNTQKSTKFYKKSQKNSFDFSKEFFNN